jgi:hypothetical protein
MQRTAALPTNIPKENSMSITNATSPGLSCTSPSTEFTPCDFEDPFLKACNEKLEKFNLKDVFDAHTGCTNEHFTKAPVSSSGPEVKTPPAGESNAGMDEKTQQAIGELDKMSPLQMQEMIRSGNIPKSIAENPIAMQAMVQRLQDFSRMVQMISQMMQMEHDTLSAIIRNIKS